MDTHLNHFLILTYNEGAKKFVGNDCDEVLQKIDKEKPLIIIVCTQESSASGIEHYQHVLREKIKHNYKLLLKIDNSMYKGSIINPYSLLKSLSNKNHNKVNKNIRTRIYYLYSSVFSQKSEIEYNNTKNNEFFLTNNGNQSNLPYFIEYIEMKKSTKSDLGKIITQTLFKGSNFVRLHIKNKQNATIKLAIVNSHLYFSAKKIDINSKKQMLDIYLQGGDKNNFWEVKYNKKNLSSNSQNKIIGYKLNTGYKKREQQFFDLLKEFKLQELYNEKYNIFFCGDLNFRLDPSKLINIKSINNKHTIGTTGSNNLPNIQESMESLDGGFFKNPFTKNPKKSNYKITQNSSENKSTDYFKLIINRFNSINKELSNSDLMEKNLVVNQLYNRILTNIKTNSNNNDLLSKFIENAKKFGIHLTCKIQENTNKTEKLCANFNEEAKIELENRFLPKSTSSKGMYTCIDKKLPRFPSMCDKILVGNHSDIIIKKESLVVFKKLRKSDHFMLALSGKLDFNTGNNIFGLIRTESI